MNGSHTKQEKVATFKAWLVANGGYIHPDVAFEPVPSGYSVVARQDIPADAQIVSCPFSLAITPEVSKQAISKLFSPRGISSGLSRWSERQLICTYLCMHRILDPAKTPPEFLHRPYIDILPSAHNLRTPLHFTGQELNLFKGTNLYGATLDRQQSWETEWESCRNLIASHDRELASLFTWDEYLSASTYLSSRAFPSTLLSEKPTLISVPTSYPILLPGVDSLNHARAQPVSWLVTHCVSAACDIRPSELVISLVPRTLTRRGAEILNNYGPKPNAELILGYGFALPNNPDDTIVLKIGGAEDGSDTTHSKWEVGRNAHGAEPVWEAVKNAVRTHNQYEAEEDQQDQEEYPIEDELWATEVLADMAEDLLSRLPPGSPLTTNGDTSEPRARPEVVEMLTYYLEGQRDILQSLIDFAKAKERTIIRLAQERGIQIVEDAS